jgi:VanZ family protein
LNIKHSRFYPAIIWFIGTTILLILPGNDLPHEGIFNIPNEDKFIHVMLFFGLAFLFCRPFKSSSLSRLEKRSWFISIAFYALAFGIVMEFIQKYFVPYRTYDVWDIFFDGTGALAAYICSIKLFLASEKN